MLARWRHACTWAESSGSGWGLTPGSSCRVGTSPGASWYPWRHSRASASPCQSDVGARAAIADLEPLLPTLLGAYVQPMVGSRHVSVGPRLVAGWLQPGDGDGYFALLFVPLSLRLTLDW